MDAKEFTRRLKALEKKFDSEVVNRQSHHLRDCVRCTGCVFCEGCERCYRCSYSVDCTGSSNLTHCIRCNGCHHLANCVECSSCTSSAFLVLCKDMTECNYCFGCAGLSKKDFHILNEKYSRSDYFKIVKQLTRSLRLPTP